MKPALDLTEHIRALVTKTKAAGGPTGCRTCHDGGFVYVRRDRLPEGGTPESRGVRYPQGLAYFSRRYDELATLACYCGVVKHSSDPARRLAEYQELGVHPDDVWSYFGQWEQELAEPRQAKSTGRTT